MTTTTIIVGTNQMESHVSWNRGAIRTHAATAGDGDLLFLDSGILNGGHRHRAEEFARELGEFGYRYLCPDRAFNMNQFFNIGVEMSHADVYIFCIADVLFYKVGS